MNYKAVTIGNFSPGRRMARPGFAQDRSGCRQIFEAIRFSSNCQRLISYTPA